MNTTQNSPHNEYRPTKNPGGWHYKQKSWRGLIKYFVPNIGTLFILALFFVVQSVFAQQGQAPTGSAPIFSYQGALTDQNGLLVNSNVSMIFSLYNVAEGGTALWTENHSGAQSVQVTDGQFHVLLGSQTPIASAILAGDLYLGIQVNGEEMLPRELMTSVIYAAKASGITGDLDMEGNKITNTSELSYQGNTIYTAAGDTPSLRLVSQTGILMFIDSDNNSDSQALSIYRDYGSVNPPASMIFSVNESGNLGIAGSATVAGDIIGANNIYGAGSQQIHMPGGLDGLYLNWHQGGGVFFGGGDQQADVEISNSGINMLGRSITNCGALVEANLQTPQELSSSVIDRFKEGDLLCWKNGQLEKCNKANDRLIQAVADKNGKPIIIGAELVKVFGPVKSGDILVSSNIPGYAMVNNNPQPGTVIAQALEDFDDVKGLVKAMIRKW